jgi:hypothetical protein
MQFEASFAYGDGLNNSNLAINPMATTPQLCSTIKELDKETIFVQSPLFGFSLQQDFIVREGEDTASLGAGQRFGTQVVIILRFAG